MKIANRKNSNKLVELDKPQGSNIIKRFFCNILKYTVLVIGFFMIVAMVSTYASPDKYIHSGPINQVYTLIESDGGTYLGPVIDLVYSGIGEFQYLEGGVYQGNFTDSKRDGEGTYSWENGDKFVGNWSADEMIEGTLTFADGLSYVGTFKNGKLENGVFDSEMTFASGGTYSGSIVDSLRGGSGKFVWDNGDSFSGTWEKDKMIDGTYTFADGTSYRGTFKNDSFDTGTYSLWGLSKEKGFASFKAIFTGGKITGFNFETKDGVKYNGDITGQATISYKSGNTYSGSVKDGVRNGYGVFKWNKDSKVTAYYEGYWVDGVMSGTGKYYYSDKSYPYISGTFLNGKPDGTVFYWKESGNMFTTTWVKGKCTKVVES